jgi:hypothetical protein
MATSGYVKKIMARDEKLLTQLAKTGIASVEQAEKYCDVKIKRLKRLERSKFIKLTTITNFAKEITIIQLEKKGKAYVQGKLMNDHALARAQIDHVNHDLKLTEAYYRLPEKYQKTFKCEHQLVKEIHKERPYLTNQLETCIDAAVEVNGEVIGIEVVGKTYTEKTIQLKTKIAKTYLNCTKIKWIK